MTLMTLIKKSVCETIFQTEEKNHKCVKPTFLPVEIAP